MCQAYDAERDWLLRQEHLFGICPGCACTLLCWCPSQERPEQMAEHLRQRYGASARDTIERERASRRASTSLHRQFWDQVVDDLASTKPVGVS